MKNQPPMTPKYIRHKGTFTFYYPEQATTTRRYLSTITWDSSTKVCSWYYYWTAPYTIDAHELRKRVWWEMKNLYNCPNPICLVNQESKIRGSDRYDYTVELYTIQPEKPTEGELNYFEALCRKTQSS